MSETFKNLFWDLFSSTGEEEVHKIVQSNELMRDAKNWYPYGGADRQDRSNFGTFENQQPNAIAALIEKVTNSIDSLLLKECKLKSIDPKSKNAPRLMSQAVEEFFGIPKGDLGEVANDKRMALAKNIQIIASGDKKTPDLLIYDNGEGQHPDDFKDTFLSIAKNNKTDIPFVQGKFNMGSTGAVVFCGDHRYQLIASKLNEGIFNLQNKHSENLFGFTLVRRHPLTKQEESAYGSSWYEYFAIDGEMIPSFDIDELNLHLHGDSVFSTGSIVKMYSYMLPRGTKSAIHVELYKELNQFIYKPALPVLLYEQRKFKSNVLARVVVGNHIRFDIDARDNLEQEPIFSAFTTQEIGTVEIQAIVLKEKAKSREYIGGKSVVFSLNGQVHGFYPKTFIREELGLGFLADTMLVHVDCTNIKTNFRQDLFMANRYSLRQSEKLNVLEDKIKECLKTNEVLRALNAKKKNEIISGGDDKHEKELVRSLLSKVPMEKELLNLLKKHGDLDFLKTPKGKNQKNKPDKNREKQSRPLESKRFPSIFKIKLKENADGKRIKSIPLNGKGVVEFQTNVQNDYLLRPLEKGELELLILEHRVNDSVHPNPAPSTPNVVEDHFDVTISGPNDHSIKIVFEPNQRLSVGDEIKMNAKLTSPDGDLESIFYVKIVDKKKNKNKKTKQEEIPDSPALPKIIKVSKDEQSGQWVQDNGNPWDEEGWDEKSVIKIIASSDGGDQFIEAIAININSYILQKYIARQQAANEKHVDIIRNKYISQMYLHSLFLYSILEREKSQSDDAYASKYDSLELISGIFKQYGNVLLHLDAGKEVLEAYE